MRSAIPEFDSPRQALAPAPRMRIGLDEPARAARVRNSVYEGAAVTRRTYGWNAPTVSPNYAVLPALNTLRDRSRSAVRNDGYAKGAIDKLVTNIVGTGIKPLSQAEDIGFRRDLQALWTRWTDESDADGLLDWYGQQAQAVRGWLEAGEIYLRLRPRLPEDGLPVSLQVQVIEPELCPHTWNRTLPNGNRIRAGVEFNGIGRRVAYWFHPSRPGDLLDFDPGTLRRIPADLIIHLYDPLRAGQLRGLPHLTQALILLRELDKYNDATVLRMQIGNLFAGFVRKPINTAPSDINPLTGQAPETLNDKPFVSMEAGQMQELDPGDEVDFTDPPEAGSTYADFMRQQLYGAAAATGVPYELLTGDMSKVNDRTVRVIVNEFAGRIEAWQHQIVAHQVCRRVWRAFVDRVFLDGVLPIPAAYVTDPQPWVAAKFTPPRRRYIHPVQDVEAQRAAIRSGFTSRQAVVSEYGEDAEVVDQEQADDNARADRLGLTYDSDGRGPEKTTALEQTDQSSQEAA
jgi:lambda family phage portal protein